MNITRFGWMTAMLATLSLGALGCSGDDEDTEAQPLEVIGDWESTFGDQTFEENITAEEWSFAKIVDYDNAKNVVITQNPDGDDPELSPNKFSRIVYLEPKDDAFYYCTTDFGLDTLADAKAAKGPADDSDPDAAGCGEGDFPWTKLTKK